MNVLKYLHSTRGRGHTRLMLDGAKNYDRPFYIISGTMSHAQELARECKNQNAIPISLSDSASRMLATGYPIILDNFALIELITDYERTIFKITDEKNDLRFKLDSIEVRVSTSFGEILNLSLFNRIFGFSGLINEIRRRYKF